MRRLRLDGRETAVSEGHARRPTPAARRPSPVDPPCTPGDFSALQRTIGNRAVARLLEATDRSTPAGVVQRYTVLREDADKRKEARKSTTGKVIKQDAHRLYADKGLVDSANAKLKSVGGLKSGAAAGAFLELVPMAEASEGLPRIAPVVVKRGTGLTTSQSPRRGFLNQGTAPTGASGEPSYLSPADCHVAAQSVMGSDDTPIGAYDTELPIMAGPGAESAHFAPAVEGGTHIANRAKHAFFARAMPAFADMLDANPIWRMHTEVINAIRAVDPTKVEFGVNNAYAAVYRDQILPNKTLSRMFAWTFKVNEAAEAEVGRAFANVNDESQKVAMEKTGDIWNFHWAGVVILDKPDYVTLENLSTENINEINDNWYFQVYGRQSQSFHAESLRDPHATPAAVTMGFEATSQPAHPKVTFSPAPNQKVVLGWITDPANDQATLNDLQAVRQFHGANPMDALKSICSRLFSLNEGDVRDPANFPDIRRMIRNAVADLNLPTLPQPAVGGARPGGLPPPGPLPPPGGVT